MRDTFPIWQSRLKPLQWNHTFRCQTPTLVKYTDSNFSLIYAYNISRSRILKVTKNSSQNIPKA